MKTYGFGVNRALNQWENKRVVPNRFLLQRVDQGRKKREDGLLHEMFVSRLLPQGWKQ